MINNNTSPLIIQAVQARQEELEELLQIKDDSESEDLSDSEDDSESEDDLVQLRF